MHHEIRARRVFLLLIGVALFLVALLMRPFIEAFIFATVLASTLFPLHRRLTARLGGRAGTSAGLLVAAVVVSLLLPLGGLGAFLVAETIHGVEFVRETLRSEGMTGLLGRLPDSLHSLLDRGFAALSVGQEVSINDQIKQKAAQHSGKVAAVVQHALAATGEVLLQMTMMLIALFALLLDGPALVGWLEDNSPLKKGQVRELLVEFRSVSTSVIVSSIVTSAVQALVALVGFLISGVPRPLFFTLVTFLVAFVPAVGAGGACLVGALLLLAMGHPWAALFLAIWGILVVGLVDNLIKPILVKRGMQMHGVVVFFSLLGGIAAFGSVGLVLGPLIVTFLLAIVRIYSREFGRTAENEAAAEALVSAESRPSHPAGPTSS